MLDPLQRLAVMIAQLPEASEFALTGGAPGALIPGE
jgi:hypothetical protein